MPGLHWQNYQQEKEMNRLKRIISLLLLTVLAATSVVLAGSFDEQEIGFDKILNARDLGGYSTVDGRTVKRKVLIRSGELAYATQTDLVRLQTEYNLGQVIDFRYAPDFVYCPDKRIGGVEYKNIPVKYNRSPSKKAPKKRYKKLRKKSKKKLRKAALKSFNKANRSYTYSLVMSDYSQGMYRSYFDQLLANESGRGVLMHCTYGKDRTGVASFMTLIALGVDEETAYQDYAMTNSFLKKYAKKAYKKGKRAVKESDLRYAVSSAKIKYGSLENFLKEAYGLDAEKLAKLRSIYTE